MIASLPMYDWPEMQVANDAFWKVLRERLRNAGLDAPEGLVRGAQSDAVWLNENLLFSQTCGYPHATRLMGKVQLLTTPCYDVAGCSGPNYSSAIILNQQSSFETLNEVLQGTLAYNSEDSLSGYRCFSPLIGDAGTAFANTVVSGGHRNSARMVADGEADCAAIDAVCLDLLKQFDPDVFERLRVLRWGPSFPALPFITNRIEPDRNLRAMRKCLSHCLEQESETCAALRLAGIEFVPDEMYAPLANL